MAEICVIVPVYKVEQYLHRCVDSILCQTFSDFELILVNDGSPDRCGEICEEYAQKDPRITVIHQENGGLSAARNTGIDLACTNDACHWLFFVDSDDFIHPQTLQLLLSAAKNCNTSISIGNFSRTTGTLPEIISHCLTPQLVCPKDLYLQKRGLGTTAWGKLYRKELFSEMRYPKGLLHEDEFVTYRLLFSCAKVALIDAPLYGYFVNESGITGAKWNPRRMDAYIAFRQQRLFFHRMKDSDLVDETDHMLACIIASHFMQAKGQPKYQRRLRFKLRKQLLRRPSLFRSDKDIWLFSIAFPRLYKCFRKCRS